MVYHFALKWHFLSKERILLHNCLYTTQKTMKTISWLNKIKCNMSDLISLIVYMCT